ncbi:unnamed protein product [Coregonus sp. 'balchen']|nr:unnamed protein product [Coregonus sp. 'balchen']
MDKLKSVLSGTDGPNENGNILQAANEASTLGWGTRVKGFMVCFVIGVTCSVLGACMLFVPKIGILLFIILYSFGNLCSLCSTMFLMGPVKQLKRMCDKTRALATTIMLRRRTSPQNRSIAVRWRGENRERVNVKTEHINYTLL